MLFLVVILVLFSLLAIPTPNLALCPGDCLCDNTRLSVNCSDVYLPDMPMTLNPHIKSMRINYAGLERIESNLQFYPDLIVCDLRYNRISSLTPYVFESQAQLSKLLLGHNRINTVYKESLEGLTNLLTLDLSNNKLSHLGPNIFADLHRLGHLDLSANNIGTVHRLAFQGLDDTLLSLNLEQNRLVSVPVDSLSSLSNLQSLSLAYNSLKRLEMSGPQSTDDSIQMKALTKLDLSFSKAERTNICQLLDLAPKLEHLVYLGNSANQLACIENNNIQSLELGFNDNLESLDPAVFYSMSRLKSLSIQNCPQLDKIAVDTLMANTRLEEINITSNLKLETISLEVFSHLPSLRILNLSNNSLRSVKPVEGTRFAQLDLLNISENPLDCNCTSRGLTVAGLESRKIICFTHKDDISADFMLTLNSLFDDVTCLTPFTIKLVFLTSLTLVLALLFTVSLTVQAIYFNRRKAKQEHDQEQESSSLLISLPLSTCSNKVNVVSDLESSMMTAWHHDLATARSLDNLDLKDHRDLEEFTKRFYSGHFTLEPSVTYIGSLNSQENFVGQQPSLQHERPCDCVGHLHHSQHQLYY